MSSSSEVPVNGEAAADPALRAVEGCPDWAPLAGPALAACRALFGGIVLNASKRFFFGVGPRDGASRTSDAKGSSLTTTLGYVVGLVLLAAVFAWYERGQFAELNKKGLAIALSLQCASNCFMFHCIFTFHTTPNLPNLMMTFVDS